MQQIPYIFNQLVAYIPKDYFDRLVKKFNGNRSVKNYTCWNHLLVMIWAQLTSRRSLRDLEASLRAHYDKTYRLGIGKTVSRSNIAYTAANRDISIFRELALEMMRRTSRIAIKDDVLNLIAQAFGINGFFAIDSSTITFGLGRHTWSEPQKGYGGIKLHTMLDLLRQAPRMCLVTGHEERDQTFMSDYPYEAGCLYVFDKLYFKTRGLFHIHSKGAYFVTRIKDNVVYDVVENCTVDGVHVLTDNIIRFSSRWAKSGYPDTLRLIHFYSTDNNCVIKFITNNFTLDAATIALLYKCRWDIEVFFKWIKQHLRVTTFFGTSGNAVISQIYTAYITYCALALAADAVGHKGSLYEFSNIMSVSLTEKTMLKDLMCRYNSFSEPDTIAMHPSLFDFDNLSNRVSIGLADSEC